MSAQPNPIQLVAQADLTAGVTAAEKVIATDPAAMPEVSFGEKQIAAFLLWEQAGADPNTPYTLNFWLEAETALETQTA